jgi:pyridoxal phosphate enzyme (YggS family)
MTTIADNLQRVHSRITQACALAARPRQSVVLLAVSKTFGADAVRQAYAAGQTGFGENYIQEAVDKMAALADLPLQWHCIGPIQSNKTRLVAAHFDWVHSVDRLKIAQRLSEQRPANLPPLQICIQVNTDGGPTKAGVAPADLSVIAGQIRNLPGLQLRGLMSIPEPADTFEAACAVHAQTKALFDSLNAQDFELDTLSLGMTSDLEAAIHSGSTMVRVGSAIFGARDYAQTGTAATTTT